MRISWRRLPEGVLTWIHHSEASTLGGWSTEITKTVAVKAITTGCFETGQYHRWLDWCCGGHRAGRNFVTLHTQVIVYPGRCPMAALAWLSTW